MKKQLNIVEAYDLPSNPDADSIYVLLPKNFSQSYYDERTDRNIGWITKEEQEMLRNSVVGVAGCGGMGGHLAATLVRLGVGEVRIADCELFDVSNINRQFAATSETVGKSKAFETARMLRQISKDSKIVVYPKGISSDVVEHFVTGCNIISDEIEFWELAACIELHQCARRQNISLINAVTVGFSVFLFYFTPHSKTVEEMLGISLEEAIDLGKKIKEKPQDEAAVEKVMENVIRVFAPEIPQYYSKNVLHDDRKICLERLRENGWVSIIATNPLFASGFTADRILLELLGKFGLKRDIVLTPATPGYLGIDAATMKVKIVKS